MLEYSIHSYLMAHYIRMNGPILLWGVFLGGCKHVYQLLKIPASDGHLFKCKREMKKYRRGISEINVDSMLSTILVFS